MTGSNELGEFLRTRRAGLQPDDVGVQGYGLRRVPGLRREELAMLAGVSPTYYSRLEQGLSANASLSVITSIARALRLSDDEQAHLVNLARHTPATLRPPRPEPDHIRPGTLRLLRSLTTTPAIVIGKRSEVLGWNELGHRLVAGHLDVDSPADPLDRPTMTRMLFLDAHTRELYVDWGGEASRAVSSLRVLGGKNPDDPELAALVGELTVKSTEFSEMWADHRVENCVSGVKRFRHPDLGEFELAFEVLTPPDDSGHRVIMYSATDDGPTAESLALLGRINSRVDS
ncbi:helix-turn-helix domain-containing protein [Curtobacterium sp. NPDC090217]|uniref:helix-turn-helix domain-containing protein n=1 Tax=Curtobacterium sp. NPDC090217 TaxID=3363970 RepID=UPI00380521EB